MLSALENLRRDIRRKTETDYIMPIWLPYLPYILILIGTIVMVLGFAAFPEFAAFFIWSFVLMIAGELINIYVLYRWIKRRNEHFNSCLLYTSPSPRDRQKSRMPSSA